MSKWEKIVMECLETFTVTVRPWVFTLEIEEEKGIEEKEKNTKI